MIVSSFIPIVLAVNYPKLNDFVTDNADVIDSQYESALLSLAKQIEQQTTVEFAVVTIPSLEGIDIEVELGAIEKKKFPAKLTFIAPKGTEENGAVQFKIKADVTLDEEYFVRAGYSANADIVLEKKDSVLSIKESLLQFDKKTEDPYVEIKTGDQEFERKDLDLGISDGINVEILSGVTEEDEIKIWNKTKTDGEGENN